VSTGSSVSSNASSNDSTVTRNTSEWDRSRGALYLPGRASWSGSLVDVLRVCQRRDLVRKTRPDGAVPSCRIVIYNPIDRLCRSPQSVIRSYSRAEYGTRISQVDGKRVRGYRPTHELRRSVPTEPAATLVRPPCDHSEGNEQGTDQRAPRSSDGSSDTDSSPQRCRIELNCVV